MNKVKPRHVTAWPVAVATLCISVLLGSVGVASEMDHHVHSEHSAVNPETKLSFKEDMNQSMGVMMQAMHASGYTRDPDIDFLAMMVPHHQGAVDMARLVLAHGRDPVTRQLAEDIIAGQTIEIESMQRRLALLRQKQGRSTSEFPLLSGTRGP